VELRNTTKRCPRKKSMPKTFYKPIEEKQNFLTKNPTPFFQSFLSRFSAFLYMAIPKTPPKN
jgi:hypothetical protein